MADYGDRGLLSIGVFLITLVISIVLYTPLEFIDWSLIPPFILTVYGCWMLILAGIRGSSPRKYQRSPFETSALGLLLIAVGGAWFTSTYSLVYSIAIILLLLGILAVTAALRRR